nr:MAG TPA: hypothetical protein [Caudoviricetes sp.]
MVIKSPLFYYIRTLAKSPDQKESIFTIDRPIEVCYNSQCRPVLV